MEPGIEEPVSSVSPSDSDRVLFELLPPPKPSPALIWLGVEEIATSEVCPRLRLETEPGGDVVLCERPELSDKALRILDSLSPKVEVPFEEAFVNSDGTRFLPFYLSDVGIPIDLVGRVIENDMILLDDKKSGNVQVLYGSSAQHLFEKAHMLREFFITSWDNRAALYLRQLGEENLPFLWKEVDSNRLDSGTQLSTYTFVAEGCDVEVRVVERDNEREGRREILSETAVFHHPQMPKALSRREFGEHSEPTLRTALDKLARRLEHLTERAGPKVGEGRLFLR